MAWVSTRPPNRKATPGRARDQREVEGARITVAPDARAESFGGGRVGGVARLGESFTRNGQEALRAAARELAGGGLRPRLPPDRWSARRPSPGPPPGLRAPAWPACHRLSVCARSRIFSTLFLRNPGDDFARDLVGRHILHHARLALLSGQGDRWKDRPSLGSGVALARCSAGMTVRIFAMPTCGLLRGSGR